MSTLFKCYVGRAGVAVGSHGLKDQFTVAKVDLYRRHAEDGISYGIWFSLLGYFIGFIWLPAHE